MPLLSSRLLLMAPLASVFVAFSACMTAPIDHNPRPRAVKAESKSETIEKSAPTKAEPAERVPTQEAQTEPAADPAAQTEIKKDAESSLAVTKPVADAAQSKDSEKTNFIESNSVPAEKALGWLKNGNMRFVKGRFRGDGVSQQDRDRLVQKEQAHSVILSCSDSRVPPEVIFDQKLGEIYVVRSQHLNLTASTIGSVEHAVRDLGTNLIVVMAHDNCRVASEDRAPSASNGDDLSQEASANSFKNFSSELIARSKVLAARAQKGDLLLRMARYNLATGKVEFE